LNRYSSVIFSVGKSEDEKRRDEERGKWSECLFDFMTNLL
jgi:hypothetical protein